MSTPGRNGSPAKYTNAIPTPTGSQTIAATGPANSRWKLSWAAPSYKRDEHGQPEQIADGAPRKHGGARILAENGRHQHDAAHGKRLVNGPPAAGRGDAPRSRRSTRAPG